MPYGSPALPLVGQVVATAELSALHAGGGLPRQALTRQLQRLHVRFWTDVQVDDLRLARRAHAQPHATRRCAVSSTGTDTSGTGADTSSAGVGLDVSEPRIRDRDRESSLAKRLACTCPGSELPRPCVRVHASDAARASPRSHLIEERTGPGLLIAARAAAATSSATPPARASAGSAADAAGQEVELRHGGHRAAAPAPRSVAVPTGCALVSNMYIGPSRSCASRFRVGGRALDAAHGHGAIRARPARPRPPAAAWPGAYAACGVHH